MRPQFVLDYIKRCHRSLKNLSDKGEGNIMYLWWDFFKCSIRHKAIINHYTRGKLYRLKGCERRKSMTYGRICKLFSRLNNPDSVNILINKQTFNSHFSEFVKRRWLYSKDMTFDEFAALCDECPHLIIKPADGVEGDGIRKIAPPRQLASQHELFLQLSQSPCMIEECITQHSDMIFNNTSVNTIRAHTLIDKDGNVQVMKMLLRAGVGDSVVDNYAQGGCVYEIDIETGHIISPSLKKDGTKVYTHPGTDIFMLGRRIPNWQQITEGIKRAHKLIPGCRFIGWDVAVTESGDIELIEGNHNPDYELLEFFGSTGWYAKISPYI